MLSRINEGECKSEIKVIVDVNFLLFNRIWKNRLIIIKLIRIIKVVILNKRMKSDQNDISYQNDQFEQSDLNKFLDQSDKNDQMHQIDLHHKSNPNDQSVQN